MIRRGATPGLRDGRDAAATVGRVAMFAVCMAMAGCQPSPPTPPPPPPAPPPKARVAPPPAAVVPPPVAMPSIDLPPGAIYVCDVAGVRSPIEFDTNVEGLCRRHPEMGPCQYERDACRRRGGRVYTSKGEEVTLAVEAEYDRKVRRVRFQGDTPAKR